MRALEKQAFVEWLRKNQLKIVGKSCAADSCPIATWAREVTGAPGASAAGDHVTVDGWTYSANWIKEAIGQIDKLGQGVPVKVSGITVLALMNLMTDPINGDQWRGGTIPGQARWS